MSGVVQVASAPDPFADAVALERGVDRPGAGYLPRGRSSASHETRAAADFSTRAKPVKVICAEFWFKSRHFVFQLFVLPALADRGLQHFALF